jgi:hypothetical protein
MNSVRSPQEGLLYFVSLKLRAKKEAHRNAPPLQDHWMAIRRR